MGLAGEHELDGPVPVGQDAHKPLRIAQQKIRTLVRRKAASKAQRQRVRIEHLRGLRKFLRGERLGPPAVGREAFADVVNERLAALGSKLPKIGVAGRSENTFSSPT